MIILLSMGDFKRFILIPIRFLPDEGLETGTGNSFRDVGEELQAELTQEVILPLQGQQHQVRTHTAEEPDGKRSHLTEIITADLLY